MDLTIGMRLIEGGKSKRAVIISEIRRRNTYPSRATKVKTNKRLRRWWCHRIQDRQVKCWGQNQRWVIWRDSRCWRILHKFKIKREEKISKNGILWGRGHRKLLKTYERRMFPELNMARDTKAMSDGVIATKTLLWYTIAKKAIDTSTRLELCSFMRRKRDKTSTTKNSKRWIVNGLTIKELKGWFVMYGRWRNTINGVNSSECCLTPKVLRNKGKNEKGADNIKNVIVFSFCMTILLRDVRKRPVRESTLVI